MLITLLSRYDSKTFSNIISTQTIHTLDTILSSHRRFILADECIDLMLEKFRKSKIRNLIIERNSYRKKMEVKYSSINPMMSSELSVGHISSPRTLSFIHNL